MEKLKEYKMICLSGIVVLAFLVAAYVIVGSAEPADSPHTYAEHIFQEDVVNEINIEIDEADWEDMLENPLEEAYHRADVTINGKTIGNVAIRTKGNTSLTSVANSDSDRYSFKLDFYRGDDISAYTGLNLKTNLETSDGSEILALMRALESGEGLEEVLDVDEALRYLAVNVALANFDSYLGTTTHNYYLYEENGVFSILPWDFNLAFGGFGGGEVDIYEPTDNNMGGRGLGSAEKEPAEENKEPIAEREKLMETQEPDRNGQEERSFPSPEGMEGSPFGNSTEKPLVTTLLENEVYLSLYERYLEEIANTYFTEEYMASMVQKTHDLIAPYVEQDATAFYTYEEFEQACSIDPDDDYSLVYYAVNMAESIQNQLDGGEPTFDASSLKGGGVFVIGTVFLAVFKRKKELKPPKGN